MTAAATVGVRTITEALARAGEDDTAGLRFLDRRERESRASWAELTERAGRVAAGLLEAGLEPGDRVATIFPSGEGFLVTFFGVLLAGGVPAPLDPPVRLGRLGAWPRRTVALVRAVEARWMVFDGKLRRFLDEILEQLRTEVTAFALDELYRPDRSTVSPFRESREDEPALIQFSSGTTSAPKPIQLSHRALMAQARLLGEFWPDPPDGRRPTGLSWLPLHHDMGLIGCVLPVLLRPSVLTLLPPELFAARPAVWLRALSRTRATVSPAPNFAYAYCLERIRDEELDGVDLSHWQAALNGAEAVSPSTLRAFAERFGPWGLLPDALSPVYGLAEAGLAVTFSPLDRPFTSHRFHRDALAAEGTARIDPDGWELASVGTPVAGFDVAILPVDAAPHSAAEPGDLPAGRVGRIWTRGPSLMDGYVGRPELTARTLVHGWLDTGDLGFLHDGELYLTGRAKDVLVVRGRNYAPVDLETVAASVEGVRAAAAVSRFPADGPREELVLLVERRRSRSPESDETLAASCRKAVLEATGLAADRVAVVEPGTLPRTSSGKLRRAEALRRWEADSGGEAS